MTKKIVIMYKVSLEKEKHKNKEISVQKANKDKKNNEICTHDVLQVKVKKEEMKNQN